MSGRLPRSALIIAVALAIVAPLAWMVLRDGTPKDAPGVAIAPGGSAPIEMTRETGEPPPRLRPQLPEAEAPNGESEEADTMDGFVPAPDTDAIAAAWSVVDLEEIRRALPDNLYFEMSAPTNDPDVLAARQAERERWNVEYGKILAGTGTEEEIRDYYDQRARLSTDYVEFTTYLLDHYEDELPERDVGLLQLARRLHLARLEEIPRKVEEAFERKRKQDAVREAWLADEAEFGGARRDDGDE